MNQSQTPAESAGRTADSQAYIRFLDGARQLPSIREQKQRTFELLDLHPGQKVLDAGCGTGDDVLAAAQLVGDTGQAVGVDRSELMIAEAQRRSDAAAFPAHFCVGDVYHLEFADNTFDGTRAERIFEHLHRPRQALAEMVRVTRPGGRIVVASPDIDSNLYDLPHRDLTRKIVHFDCDRRPNGWAGRRLFGMFRRAGLTDITVTAVTHILTDYGTALEAIPFADRVQDAQEAGLISAEEGAQWLNALAQAGEAGHFFQAITHFIVGGRKPQP